MDFNDSSFDNQFDDKDSEDDQFFDQFQFDDESDDSSEFSAGQEQEYSPPPAAEQRSARKAPREGGLLQDMLILVGIDSSNTKWILGLLGAFFVGLFFGWIVLGWYVAPVQWIDADVSFLRKDLREDYMRMAIDSYALDPDWETAQLRLNEFGEGTLAAEALAVIRENPEDQKIEIVNAFEQWLLGKGPGDNSEDTGTADPGGAPAEEGEGESPNVMFYTLLCVLTAALGGVIVLMVLRRQKGGGPRTAAQAAHAHEISLEATNYEALGQSTPIAQWMATYLVGDDLFDDSFSIDSPTGEFLGECGVGLADTIGVGEPKRVSAFEVWLFDKNDIQTVTKVMMSNHVFADDTNRERLAAKGEPVLVKLGEQTVLETEALQMVARVVDMAYGQGALPDDSFFDRVTIELAIWQK